MDISRRVVQRASGNRSRRERFQRLLFENLESRRLLAAEFGVNQNQESAMAAEALVLQVAETPQAAAALVPTVSIDSVTSLKREGNSGPTVFSFQVTRGVDTTGITMVDFAVTGSGANAADADDFGGVFPSGTVEFMDGDVTKMFEVMVQSDTLAERDEQFTVTLTSASGGAVIEGATASSLIRNDDNVDAGDLPSPFRTLRV